jgi:hypothetical protein
VRDGFFVVALFANFAWWAAYTVLGGQFMSRYPYMPRTWGNAWRSIVAGCVALAFAVLAGGVFDRR